MVPSNDLFIDGKWIPGAGERLVSTSPADGALAFEGNAASKTQCDEAIAAAVRAQISWARKSERVRFAVVQAFADYLNTHREDLAQLISREISKPLWESRTEVAASIGKAQASIDAYEQRRQQYEAPASGGFQAIERFRPLGVMLVLGPFNFPAHLPGGQIIPSLIAGNTIVFKPSEQAPGVGRWLVQAWEQAGKLASRKLIDDAKDSKTESVNDESVLPAGSINLLQGGVDVATAMIDNPQIAGVLFTGSYGAGRAIHTRLSGRPEVLLALEMGGNNPLVVLDAAERSKDESMDAIVHLIIQSAFISAGQRCTCARRLIVVDNPGNRQMVKRLTNVMPHIACGLPDSEPSPFVGPLISTAAADAVLAKQKALQNAGGQILVEAQRSEASPALITPGLIDVTDCEVPDEECFGPLLQVHWVGSFTEAIALANATRFGLAAGLVGGSRDDFAQFRAQVRAGVINWNRQTTGASGRLAFGGVGSSGNHRPAGYHAADFCSDPVASLESEVASLPDSHSPGLEDLWK